MTELDDLRTENARLRGALEEIRSTHWDRRVNRICRRGLGIPDDPFTVRLHWELERERPRPWMRRRSAAPP